MTISHKQKEFNDLIKLANEFNASTDEDKKWDIANEMNRLCRYHGFGYKFNLVGRVSVLIYEV